MKKNLSLVLSLVLILGLTGCGNSNESTSKTNNKNILVCTSNISLGNDMYIIKSSTIGDDDNDNPENWEIGFATDSENVETGEYKFIFDNNGLKTIKAKEIYKKSVSETATDKDLEEINKQDNFKASKKDGKVILEYSFDNDDSDMIKGLNAHYPNKKELKEFLEEEKIFSCK